MGERSEGRAKVSTRDGGARGWRARAWRYGPVLLWVGVIFFASTGNLSASNTSRVVGPLLLWLDPTLTEDQLLRVHFFVRKAAHFTEYAVLALLASRAFLTSSRAALRNSWHVLALALVAAVALLDEYNQSLNPARTGTIYDSGIDFAGGVFAVCALAAWRHLRARRRRHERVTLS